MTTTIELAKAVLASKSVDLTRLTAPFPPEAVSWRVGVTTPDKKRGLPLAYIDARDVMDRLDEVCGIAGWQCRYSHAGPHTTCELSIRIDGEWITKSDGSGESDIEAEKGAASSAFKRAAVRFGIGRYLYHIKAPWVAIEPAGKSFKIADTEYPKLRLLLTAGQTPTRQQAATMPRGTIKKTELKRLLRAFVADLHACEEPDQVEALLGSPETVKLLKAAEMHIPDFYSGSDGEGDCPGIKQQIESARRTLTKSLRDSVTLERSRPR